jgi:hypothetical protein
MVHDLQAMVLVPALIEELSPTDSDMTNKCVLGARWDDVSEPIGIDGIEGYH